MQIAIEEGRMVLNNNTYSYEYFLKDNLESIRTIFKEDGKSTGSLIYKIAYVLTSEGRIVEDASGNFDYEYFLRDNLGNVRVTFADYANNGIAEVLQEDSYYPFGMRISGLSSVSGTVGNNYLYNSKELYQQLGFNLYDYGSCFYDVQLGRWHAYDPKAENYWGLSPFNYGANNPVYYIDPDGEGLLESIAIAAAAYFVIQTLDNMINKDMSFSESLENTFWVTGTNINLDANYVNSSNQGNTYNQNLYYPGYFDDLANNYSNYDGSIMPNNFYKPTLEGVSFDFVHIAAWSKKGGLLLNGGTISLLKDSRDHIGITLTFNLASSGLEFTPMGFNLVNGYRYDGNPLYIEDVLGYGSTKSRGAHLYSYAASYDVYSKTIPKPVDPSFVVRNYGLSIGAPGAYAHYDTYTIGFSIPSFTALLKRWFK